MAKAVSEEEIKPDRNAYLRDQIAAIEDREKTRQTLRIDIDAIFMALALRGYDTEILRDLLATRADIERDKTQAAYAATLGISR